MIRSLWITGILACSGAIGVCSPLSAPTLIFSRPLPTANVNGEVDPSSGQSLPRSNYAFTETGTADDPLLQTAFDGDDFTLDAKTNSSYIVTSLSTWSVASSCEDGPCSATSTAQPLGDEFQSVSLYIRPVAVDPISGGETPGSPWQIVATGTPNTSFIDGTNVVGNSNPNLTDTNVTYASGQNYEGDGSPGTYYPLWETTFANLNLTLAAGVTYQFAVWGLGWYNNDVPCGAADFQCMDPNTLYGYWFNEYSNPGLSGNFQQGADGFYQEYVNFLNPQICPPSANCGISASAMVQGMAADGTIVPVDQNVLISGIGIAALPEPASFVLAGLGLVILGCLARKRRK